MKTRFKKGAKIFDIVITAVAGMFSVGMMLYGVYHFGLAEAWPELVAVKYVSPVGQKLGWHHHPVMNYGVLMQGELTIIGQDGKKKVVHEGEPVVEMVNTIHHGENTGTVPVILYMFYLSQKDMPLAVQHPEIPLE